MLPGYGTLYITMEDTKQMVHCKTTDCNADAIGGYDVCEAHLEAYAIDVCAHMRLQLREEHDDDLLTEQDQRDTAVIRTLVHSTLNN